MEHIYHVYYVFKHRDLDAWLIDCRFDSEWNLEFIEYSTDHNKALTFCKEIEEREWMHKLLQEQGSDLVREEVTLIAEWDNGEIIYNEKRRTLI